MLRTTYLITTLALLTVVHATQAQTPKKMFHYSLNQSFPSNSAIPRMYPFGVEWGFSWQTTSESPVYLGFASGYQNYGRRSLDDVIVTSHNIYNLNFGITLEIFETKKFRSYLRGSVGFSRVVTRSYTGTNEAGHAAVILLDILLTDDEDDEDDIEWDLEPLNVLHKFTDVVPEVGTGLGMQCFLSKQDVFFFEAGYRYLGPTKLIEKDHVEIDPDQINYQITRSQLRLLNFKIGLAHYF